MDTLRLATSAVLLTLALTGCVQQEDAVTEDPGTTGQPPRTPLSVTAPGAVQAEATGLMTTVNLGQATATGGDGNYTFSHDAPAAGFPLGSAMVTWTATDGAGAQATDMQSVTVSDTTAPSITLPPDIQTTATGATTMVGIGTAMANDLVDPTPALTNDRPVNGFPVGTTGVTWTATDASGNVATGMQMITVTMPDPGQLSLMPPGPITAEATGPTTPVMLGAAMASGGTPPITITNDAPAGGFPLGTTTVTWTGVDANMLSASGTQLVTIVDTTAPSITAPADVAADQDAGGGNTVVDLGMPVFSDLVDPNPVVSNDAPASGFPVGTTTVTWTATDATGNSATDTQLVMINDAAFTVTAPNDVTMEATGPATTVALGDATPNGGVAPVTVSSDAPAGGFPVGVTTVTWTATDATMATAMATQTVTITDTTAPTITAPADVAADQDSGGGNTTVDLGTPTFSDIADPSPTVSNNAPVSGFPVGTTTVVWTATDASGNSASDTQLVMINASAFTVTAPPAVTTEATGPTTVVALGTATPNGGVPPVNVTNDAPAAGFPVGVTTVTWTATDAAMATAMATQTVTIMDTTAPSITAPADVTADQDAGGGNTFVSLGSPTFDDIADPSPAVSNNAPASGFPVGTTTVIWTATDASGNSGTDTQQVTINAAVVEMCSSMVTEFVNTIYPIMNNTSPLRCNGCHTGPAPLATANGWGFPNDPPGADDFELFRTIAAIDGGGQSLILAKSTGGLGHVGGDRWPARPNDPEFDTFADFVNRAAVCQPDPPASTATIDLGSGYEQLHRIAAALGARTPSGDEIATINAANSDQQAIDAALDAIIDGLMNEELFYTRVQEIYNDVLLTNRDAFDRGNVDDNFDLDAFANRDFYEDNYSGDTRGDLRQAANYGFARAPIELVKYVVENDRPFTEVVAADYTMVNPYSAVIYGVDAGDPSFRFDSDRNQANHDVDDFRPVNNVRQQDGTLVPAAGIMGTHAFLARYPSTNTNVNRARARYVFDYFLGVDIESLAARDSLDLDNVIGSVPTYEDPQCTVCHNTMDPVAGLFTNRDNDGEYDTGNRFQHTRTTNGVPRMVPAGYTMDPADVLPSSEEDTALQWLGGRIAQDDRFAERTARTVFRGLTGIEATSAATTAFVNEIKNRFVAANFDFKLLVKDVISSDYFMARNLAVGEDANAYADIGAGRLLTAEELDRKITSVTGGNYEWRGPNSNSGLRDRHYLLYGGIDSDEVITRTTEPNALIDGIQERISNQVACQRVADDLYNGGILFPFVDETDVPDGGAGENAIRQNIQFLHRHILGEDLALTDPEIDATYQLFLDVRAEGATAIQGPCRGGGSSSDNNGTVIPWMAVVTYLLADYRFLYE